MRRSVPEEPGWTRRRAGRGFSYLHASGRLATADERVRFASLAIPPAWNEVWICADPEAHLQAVGVDAAGRRQYIYHPDWVAARALEKFERVAEFGRRLGRARVAVDRHLALPDMPLERACATAFRMLDVGALRVGNDVYAEDDSGFGLTTLQRRHARLRGDTLLLRFTGKSGVEHRIEIADPQVLAALQQMRRRRGSPDLLSYREPGRSHPRWAGLRSEQVNRYIRGVTGRAVSAKDFRTWHATVVAARVLAQETRHPPPDPGADPVGAAQKVALRAAAELLGNTVAQAKESYVDPRVLAAHTEGRTVRTWRDDRDLERAVLEMLGGC